VQPETLLDSLRALVGPASVLSGVDASPYVIEGRTPLAVVFPGSAEDVGAVLGLAGEAAVPVTPWGGGTAIGVGGSPDRLGIVLNLSRMSRLLEHEPGDLTATAQAGMPLRALQTALGERGQWLSLDPPDADVATVGGVLSANAAGSRRHLYGTARDLVIGITVVCADGAVVRGGGKVVKNVAGYDLPKLFVGAYGTLGVIVEATLKLRPRPDAEVLLAARFGSLKDCGLAARQLLLSDLIPSAVDVLDGDAAGALGLSRDHAVLVVGFDGLAEQVEWQRGEFERIVRDAGGERTVELPSVMWASLPIAARLAVADTAAVMRMSVLPARVTELIERAGTMARGAGLRAAFSAHAGVGAVCGALAGRPEAIGEIVATLAEWRSAARAAGGHAEVELAPLAVKEQLDPWDDAGAALRIMQRIKAQLDPRGVLNPGRFVGAI
jgi:glycolate oxidase FAD binding subunit